MEESNKDLEFVLSENEEIENAESTKEKKARFADVFEWLDVLVTAMIAVVLIFSFFLRFATIDGPSMEDTLFDGEKIIMSNFFYTPKAGDIVVISRNTNNRVEDISKDNTPIIKRVIATEGQIVDIDFNAGTVMVDGEIIDEPYIKNPTTRKHDIEFPVTVDEGCVFVLGDNREISLDSRSSQIGEYGMIDTRYILGHAFFRVLPFEKFGALQ